MRKENFIVLLGSLMWTGRLWLGQKSRFKKRWLENSSQTNIDNLVDKQRIKNPEKEVFREF